jgi:hypothetical protein
MTADDIPWDELLRRIDRGALTPFLGAGISRPPLPNAAELADILAGQWKYPFCTERDLMQVAQYRATRVDGSAAKGAVAELLKRYAPPDFKDPSQPHVVLASLPIPVYLTTNYDNYMEEALQKQLRKPLVEVCRWNSGLRTRRSYLLEDKDPDVGTPVVFHLHGHIDDPDSFVLTEDDYLDFIVNARRYEASTDTSVQMLTPRLVERIANTSLLFIGYGLRDWNLRVLLRALVQSADVSSRKLSVSVQLVPPDAQIDGKSPSAKADATRFLERYFEGLEIRIFWGTAQEFLTKLKSRWDDRQAQPLAGGSQ